MEIVVCVKQVPDVDNIKWTKENNLDRSNMLSAINPYDEIALDAAIDIKNRLNNVNINVISMGPNQALSMLEYAIAKGADRGILLSDKAFSGSDTLITSKILSAAIKKYVPNFDLILTGELAVDGDTKQVPVSLSVMLDIIDNTSIIDIKDVDLDKITVVQKLDETINVIEAKYPTLIAIHSYKSNSYIPKIDDYIKAHDTKIEIYNLKDLCFDCKEVGVIGSPTMVYRAFRPNFEKNAIEIKENINETITNFIKEVKNE